MREKSYIVYLHINKINRKIYVGITRYVDNPNRRWRNGNGYRRDSIIYKAINKYGWDNFNHIIFCKTSKRTACLLERSLIKLYKKRKISYNIGLGGEGSESFSEETKEKLRSYIKGRGIRYDLWINVGDIMGVRYGITRYCTCNDSFCFNRTGNIFSAFC